jgi:hypothetical protein
MLTEVEKTLLSGLVNYDSESTTVHLVFTRTEVGGPSDRLGKICKPFTTTLGCSEPSL